jgi:pimeloyl-ACP methyl ester carboxylesterase
MNRVNIFVPELPGFGISSWSAKAPDESFQGDVDPRYDILDAIQYALLELFPPSRDKQSTKLILVGHGRGALLCHQLATREYSRGPESPLGRPRTEIVGLVLFGIGSMDLHIPGDIDETLAGDGAAWCRAELRRLAGSDPDGSPKDALAKVEDGGAADAYAALYSQPGVMRAVKTLAQIDRKYARHDLELLAERRLDIPVDWRLAQKCTDYDGNHISPKAAQWHEALQTNGWMTKGWTKAGHWAPEQSHSEVLKAIRELVHDHVMPNVR